MLVKFAATMTVSMAQVVLATFVFSIPTVPGAKAVAELLVYVFQVQIVQDKHVHLTVLAEKSAPEEKAVVVESASMEVSVLGHPVPRTPTVTIATQSIVVAGHVLINLVVQMSVLRL